MQKPLSLVSTRPLTCAEALVPGIDVAGEQEGAQGVSACDDDGGHIADIRSQAGRCQLLHKLLGGN